MSLNMNITADFLQFFHHWKQNISNIEDEQKKKLTGT